MVILKALRCQAEECTRCDLYEHRKQVVFARGNIDAPIVLLGEAPGATEDEEGVPFVGRAGKLLDSMLEKAEIQQKQVYIMNAVKCRPPSNREPTEKELDSCARFKYEQIETVKPRVIVGLGKIAAESIGISTNGIWAGTTGTRQGAKTIVTYHPAYVLRKPDVELTVIKHLRKAKQMAMADVQ